ncbi:2-amino-4-hydroxy-6-hydroxymethyldihydropteridine diphosphokinase [Rhizobium sp. Leaf341]|uniref:2-amino-4-hydroxy-6- hydroxymethyldihydropteridine diphosphokinase n=1 Tax=Rhizobium sp. Leaf341 TaxID=1736344 RepID=UPI0007122E5B|nr:2-amino-4-hydroxy-6-hydroxymethyldihydropteridine diphosphokinase [Rhizobium sp. Leaf341]KQR68774.1 2-amino-4-hydroxy-6-hydroxymethyldihydropteridine pyrophosphokinase [Rhizobium sp. Leaf341]
MTAIDDGRWHQAAIGLGGNIGDAATAIARALAQLDARSDATILEVSRLYRTPPWGKTDQDWFFNACAVVQTTLDPLGLLEACLDVEKAMKRLRLERWGPRTIDLDVLTYDTITMETPELTLPHPRMTSRAFVLLPLCDILPDHVVAGRRIAAWAGDADAAGIELADGRADWWRDRV